MPFNRIETSDYTDKDISGLVNAPSAAGMSAADLKARFDSLVKDLIVLRYNDLVDKLNSATSTSGASHVTFYPTVKANYTNVQAALAAAYDYTDTQIAAAVFGDVSPAAANISVVDAGNHFTGTNVETILAELFTMIGTSGSDVLTLLGTGALSTYIQTNATYSKVIVSNSSGKLAASALDADILSFLTGITANVQTQINGKMSGVKTISASDPTGGANGDVWFKV